MQAYIYQADIYCEGCTHMIRGGIIAGTCPGQVPNDPDDETTFDSDDWPKGPYPDGGGESDSPQHCDSCGAFLENPLTPDGLRAVAVAIEAHDRHGYGVASVINEWRNFYRQELESA